MILWTEESFKLEYVADRIYFIINRERAGVHFDILYEYIFQRCRKPIKPS
uniref:Uncharacterized protein n=1 Tax=Physcomitrium patens TaxID=3218 RepID=A0A2K1J3E3_PHYPA|nr:hypothetical protein PHYPA_021893 [Physcomitrium patens]